MAAHLHPRREAARSFFAALQSALRDDEVLADKRCVRLLLEREQAERETHSRKRFDAAAVFRQRVLFGKIDDFIGGWCRRHEVRTDPYTVFRYEGRERGPTQHETGLRPSIPFIDRAFDRLSEAVPEIPDCRALVARHPHQVIAPGFRLQHPLPFGAAGEVLYDAARKDIERGIYLVAMYAATGGDPSRNWRYDCGLLIVYASESPRTILGAELFDLWPDVQDRVWRHGRVWTILM